jgi:hypothetical protein
MRLLIGGAVVAGALSLSLVAQKVAAADSCQKTIYVYVDVSETMNKEGADKRRPLTGFATAVGNLIASDFINEGDVVQLVAFAGGIVPVRSADTRTSASTTLAQLATEAGYATFMREYPQLDRDRTDLAGVLAHVRSVRENVSGPRYYIIAGDFLHDPDNHDSALSRARSKQEQAEIHDAWLKQVTDLTARIGQEAALTSDERMIPLLPREVTQAPDMSAAGTFREALTSRVLSALETQFNCPHYSLKTLGFDDDEIRKRLAVPPDVHVAPNAPLDPSKVTIDVINRNPFRIQLRQVIAYDDKGRPYGENKTKGWIPCGLSVRREIKLPATEQSSVQLKVEVTADTSTSPTSHVVNLNTIVIDSLEVQPIRTALRAGTLVLNVKFDNQLRKPSKLNVKVGPHTPPFVLDLEPGLGEQQFIIPIQPLGDDVKLLERKGTIDVELSVDEGRVFHEGQEVTHLSPTSQPNWFTRWILLLSPVLGLIGSVISIALLFDPPYTKYKIIMQVLTVVVIVGATVMTLLSHTWPLFQEQPAWLFAGVISASGAVITFCAARFLLVVAWFIVERELMPHGDVKKWRTAFAAALLLLTVVGATALPIATRSLWTNAQIARSAK